LAPQTFGLATLLIQHMQQLEADVVKQVHVCKAYISSLSGVRRKFPRGTKFRHNRV